MREAAKEPGLSPDRLFGVVFSFRHLKMILGLEFSWLGHVWGVGASERQLGDALGYGARKINPLAWPQALFAHCLVVRGTSRRQDKVVGACMGFRQARIPSARHSLYHPGTTLKPCFLICRNSKF